MAATTKTAPKTKKGTVLRAATGRLIVKPDEAQDESDGGIVLPDSAKEKPHRGKVLDVGPGRVLESGDRAPVDYRVDQTVIFGRYDGTTVKVGGEERVILSFADVLAIVE